ncbi:MAG: 2-C-methyl-D-erythritol 4-phosphate cytidylyltransferase [Candidatus Omnitrophica bacterium]|nr:2-C-methyl-D-erythritol 4-phosphate cytidylyltransferase [Candidatus Omnitrophota bacterium]
MSFVSAIIPAAGYGLRLRKNIPKALVELNRKPLFIYPLEIISEYPQISEIILVVPADYIDLFKKKIKIYCVDKIKAVVAGGMIRQESVEKGLTYVRNETKWILIHDAVRPFINFKMISEVISSAKRYGAATLGVPVSATLKSIDNHQYVKKTLTRDSVWEIHTPQVFRKELIIKAHQKFKRCSFTDDAGMVEKLGVRVKVIRDSSFNIKITYPEDLFLAEAILKYRKRYGL